MGKLRIGLFILCALPVVANFIEADFPYAWRSSLDAEMNLPGDLISRWILDIGDSRILFLERHSPESEESMPYRALGYQSSIWVLGPVDLTGLLREAGNPLGYSPSSPVFREQTGIQLYTGKERHSRFGFQASTPENLFKVGVYQDAANIPHIFTTFRLEEKATSPRGKDPETRVSYPSLEGFLSISDLRKETSGTEWFPTEKATLPGPLIHWGGKAELGFEGEWRGRIGVSLFGSQSPHENMGVLTHVSGSVVGPWIELLALVGSCNSSYLTPGGDRSARESQKVVSGMIKPVFPLFLKMEKGELGYRDRNPEGWEKIQAGLAARRFKVFIEREEGGEDSKWTVEGWGRYRSVSLNFNLTKQDSTKVFDSLYAEIQIFQRGWEWEVWWRGFPEYTMVGGSSFSYKTKKWRVGVGMDLVEPLGFQAEELYRLSVNPFAYFRASLFFSTRDSHLPIKSISGSRLRP